MRKIVFVLNVLFASTVINAQTFTSGNIVVLQAGDGATALSSTATPIFLREFTPSGTAGITFTVPVSSNTITMSGSATSEGGLTLSSNGQYLVFAGYNSAVGTTGVASTASSAAPRMVAAVNASAGITYTSNNSFFSGNNIRSAASDGSGNFWGAGGNTGTCYFGTNSASVAVQTSTTNTRYVNVFNGGLYFSTGSGTASINKVGSGLPTTAGQTNSIIINTSTVGTSPSPYGFYFNPAFTICYVADDRANSNGGIQKWVNASGTWTLAYTLGTGVTNIGARGVIADFSGSNPIIYGTSAEASLNRVFKINDTGSGATATTIATATTNTIFRGIAFAPSSCASASISTISSNTAVCNTQSLGLNVSASGSSPFTYTWSGPGTLSSYSISNPVLNNPVSGDYTVSVSNACGTSTAAITVTANSGPTLAVSPATICSGTSSSLIVSGASTYTWDNSSNTATITVSPSVSTVYSVSGTSANGCNATATVNIAVNSLPTLSVNSSSICSGNTAVLQASGAVSYTWNTSATSASISVTPGSTSVYTVSGSDANNCINSTTCTVSVTPSPTLSVNSVSICIGQTATITASGANTYTWNTSATSTAISDNPLSTTIYSVIGDANGCQTNSTATITVYGLPTISVNSATICSGSTATLLASGANSYTWSTGANASSISVSPGTNTSYTVYATSLQGCSNSATTSVTLNANLSLLVNTATVCAGKSATLVASGATSYTWNTGSNASSIVVSPGNNTTYTVTGSDALGCTGSNTSAVSVNPLPTLTINNASICAGGSATLVVSGANSYTWSNSSNSASIIVSPGVSTSYSVTGTSTNGCTNSISSSINVNVLPILSVNTPSICNGSSVTLTVAGANSYTWNTGAFVSSITVSPSTTSSYSVSGTSTAGCSGSVTTSVTVNNLPILSINTSTICLGSTATLSSSGASTYTWNTGSNAANLSVTPSVTTVYTLSGTSIQGCTNSASTQVVVNPLPTVTVNSATICAGASATISASGANSYTWSTGSNSVSISASPSVSTVYTISGTSAIGCVNSNTTLITVNPIPVIVVNSATLCAGNTATLLVSGASSYSWSNGATSASIATSPSVTSIYTVAGTSLNCTGLNTATVVVNPLPVINAPLSSVCSGGTSTLAASGAATYTWSTGSNSQSIVVTPTANSSYTVSGTSAAGCVGTSTTAISVTSSPSITANSVSVCAGSNATLVASGVATYTWNTGAISNSIVITPTANITYTVSGNASGCSALAISTLAVTFNTLPIVSVNSATICSGNAATLTASGANTYSWSNSANGFSLTPSPVTTTNYTVTGTSANGCSNTAVSSVSVNATPSLSVNSASICSGAAATLVVTGANTYSWSTGASSASIIVTPTANSTYSVTGTSSGCTSSATSSVTVYSLPVISVNSATICSGNAATLIATGAATYSWISLGNTTSVVVSPTLTTSYSVSGTSSVGCTNNNSATVTVNALPSISVNSSTVCSGSAATLIASGANTYSWNTGSASSSITPSPSITSIYTVTGTSVAGCIKTATAQVLVNPLPTLTLNSPSLCAGNSATLTASGAGTYSWNTGATSVSISVSPSVTTVYQVTGTTQGCSALISSTITVNALPSVVVNSLSICSGGNATLSASGASTYTWNNNSNATVIVVSPTTTTNYTVSGTSTLGCTNTATTTVLVSSSPSITVNSTSVCSGNAATLIASGVVTYTWNNGATSASIVVSPNTTSTYTVTGNASGCPVTASTTGSVFVTATPTLSIPSATICAGKTATLLASGATSYSWNNASGSSQLIVTPSITTIYSVTGTQNNCVANATTQVIVNALPGATLNLPVSLVCVSAGSIGLSGIPAGGIFSGTAVSSSVFNPSSAGAGTYTITYAYTDNNNCVGTDSKTITVSVCSDIKDQNVLSASAYPNPAENALFISCLNYSSNYSVEIVDLTGRIRMVYEGTKNTTEIDLRFLEKGMYVAYVISGDKKTMIRFIKN